MRLQEYDILNEAEKSMLLSCYEFFKNIEACLRLFDLKSLSAFSVQLHDDSALVRAMGYGESGGAVRFKEDYAIRCDQVRDCFEEKLES